MIMNITQLESPIDAMSVIHHALRAEAAQVERIASRLQEGSTLQPFRDAFYRWIMALAYHADTEDAYMTALLPDCPAARECELAHHRLADLLEEVQRCLTEEIGRTMLIARTQRHLFGKVVMARIAQDDHLEEEEAFVLPVIRRQLSEDQQWEIIGRLLIDREADDQQWYLDWIAVHLTPRERQLVAELVARVQEHSPQLGPALITPHR
jgi:hemerythrin-like domain-containing protein